MSRQIKIMSVLAMMFAIGVVCSDSRATIVTVDFGDVWHDAQPYIEDGFSVTSTYGEVRINNWITPTMSARPSFGFDDGYLILTVETNDLFNLYAVDLTEGLEGQMGGGFEVTATFPDDSTVQVMLTPDGVPGLETFYLTAIFGVKTVAFGTNLPVGQHRIDNIVVEIIPEPATVLLLALGSLALLRRRREN